MKNLLFRLKKDQNGCSVYSPFFATFQDRLVSLENWFLLGFVVQVESHPTVVHLVDPIVM